MISCQQYDYIEIACLYKLPVKLTLQDGREIVGAAEDTLRNEEKQECMSVRTANELHIVVLDDVNSMAATEPNAHFNVVVFQ
ncbi:Rho-binding antiterminator [Photobacterium galatheae]|uniref:Rho-binding antiterminator n=1 Tax=Photobacterium galatheae TaxID=1654360 RepID=UPI00202CA7F0|nr:Rho-binding antiterminator [Photobacterium galatheae]MCM0148941.1 Rho-binding antiterminator [Photobacterium galatheae]